MLNVDRAGNLLVAISAAEQDQMGTLLASAARTATVQSLAQETPAAQGLLVFLNVSAASGTGGLVIRIQALDPASYDWAYLTLAPSVLTATGMYVIVLGPGALGPVSGAAGGVLQATAGPVPRLWRVEVAHQDASSYTYSVGYQVV